jgi:hypothetical protein
MWFKFRGFWIQRWLFVRGNREGLWLSAWHTRQWWVIRIKPVGYKRSVVARSGK